MTRIALIGAGGIARSLLAFFTPEDWKAYQIVGALVRQAGQRSDFSWPLTTRIEELLRWQPDLVIDVAGPAALAAHGETVLANAPLWSISTAALNDDDLYQRLEKTGRLSGHKLRFISGAVGGIDALAALGVHPEGSMHFKAAATGRQGQTHWDFSGSVRDATRRFHGINVLATAALAAKGLDAISVDYATLASGEARTFVFEAASPIGNFRITTELPPEPIKGIPLVGASILAALRRERAVIQMG